jgi:hypothetical protein
LGLAQRQGVLYAHQIPAVNNGKPAEHARQWVDRLLRGDASTLSAHRPGPLTPVDRDLDEMQLEAVAKAVTTPDVCLIQGLPGTGKSRVVAEILTQSARRGERILFLAPTSAAIDRVLSCIVERQDILAIRCLAPTESLQDLSPNVRLQVSSERQRSLAVQVADQARQQVVIADEHLRRLHAEEPAWNRLRELAENAQQLETQISALRDRRNKTAEEVEREACNAATSSPGDGFGKEIAAAILVHRESCARIQEQMTAARNRTEECRREQTTVLAEIDRLRPRVEAKESGHLWNWRWWQATIGGDCRAHWKELDQRRHRLEAELAELDKNCHDLADEQTNTEKRFGEQRTRLVSAELERRWADIDQRDARFQEECRRLDCDWQVTCQQLDADTSRPAEHRVQACESAAAAWRVKCRQAKAHLVFAEQWAGYVAEAPEAIASRLPHYANVFAGPIAALPAAERFENPTGNGDRSTTPFDLLVLEEADQISESEFFAAARRARRWVLVGEPAWNPTIRPLRRVGASSARQAAANRGTFFQRLWEQLHCDPRSLPYTWSNLDGRLCCRLRSLVPEQRQWLETESVADAPEIELGILTLPQTQPVLVEIRFPRATTIEQAKKFVFSELDELAVQASSHSLRWHEDSDRLVVRLAGHGCRHDGCVHLEPGVRETIGCTTAMTGTSHWRTCCVEFERANGWHRQRAEEWIQHHLGLCDLGRTVHLDLLHRMHPPLAEATNHLLCSENGMSAAAVSANGTTAPIEFVSVPPVTEDRGKSRGKGSGAAPATRLTFPAGTRGGAGLEIDLSDARQRERLPSEMRGHLPARGIVNYVEAQSVVRTLTALAADMRNKTEHGLPSFAILTLYPAQASLLRQLIGQTAALNGLPVEVSVASAFRQREADVVILSLTRSHTHRAVPYGDGPRLFVSALTRARHRLILIGDAGTLLRRSQWEGPLDHLDEPSATRERELITHLITYLQGQASPMHPVPLHSRSS